MIILLNTPAELQCNNLGLQILTLKITTFAGCGGAEKNPLHFILPDREMATQKDLFYLYLYYRQNIKCNVNE